MDGLNYRSIYIKAENGGLKTLDEDTRSVEVIGTTEDPAKVYDWERNEIVDEVLLMSGVIMPKSGQLPLLESHNRFTTESVIGSFRDIDTKKDMLIGRVYFSSTPEAEGPYTKVKEQHLTDFSVGYKTLKTIEVEAGEEKEIQGKKYKGPVLVRTKWKPKELSIVPIGADERAIARSEHINNEQGTEKKEKDKKGGNKMDETLRKFLISKGLAKEATEEEAWDFLKKLDVKEDQHEDTDKGAVFDFAVSVEDSEKLKKAAIKEERARITEIRAMCRDLGFEEKADEYIMAGRTIDEAREAIFNNVKEKMSEGRYMPPAKIEVDERDKFKAAAIDGLFFRSGRIVEKPSPGYDELRSCSLYELARESLRVSNLPLTGTRMEVVGRALNQRATVTGDLPYILANVAEKELFEGFDTNQETWSVWCGTGSVNDFKTNYLPRLGEADDLEEVPEYGEYQYGSGAEAQESFAIAKYGKIWAITRETIINDDLNALTAIPRLHGESASRKVGDLAYAVLTANAAMGDGVALFATGHSNYVADGSGAAPGIATIAAGILAMGTQKDLKGLRRLNIRPEYFIGPKALEGATEVFFLSERFSDADTVATDSSMASTQRNPYSGGYFTRVYEPRLDDNDTAAWFLAGMKGKTVNVYFLGGRQTPYLESREGWTVDGIENKVRIEAGAKAVDYRALYQNDGN